MPIINLRPRSPSSASAAQAWAMAAALLSAVGAVQAQSTPGAAAAASADKDPGMVLLRDVNPRIAYRQIPSEDMPIRSEATVFPAGAFDAAIDRALAQPLGDGELGAQASAGVATAALAEVLPALGGGLPTPALGAGAGRSGGVPLGLGAQIGGAVGGATAGLGAQIGGSVQQALAATRAPGAGP